MGHHKYLGVGLQVFFFVQIVSYSLAGPVILFARVFYVNYFLYKFPGKSGGSVKIINISKKIRK